MRDLMRFLITGSAGFIGFHLVRRLLVDGHAVLGIDGMTPYYDPMLKRRRHELLAAFPQFAARELMLADSARLAGAVVEAAADVVVHLAAQAGVRYSAENPHTEEELALWRGVSVEELRNGPSADFLRNTDQTEDLDYVLAHVDDVDAAAVFNGQQVSLLLPAAQPALAAEA